jgi:glycerol-1-phosphate dehydrogenase [NAD(P)+]
MTIPAASHRSVRIPRLMRLVRGPDAVMDALFELVGPGRPLLVVHTGTQSGTGYGLTIVDRARQRGYAVEQCVVHDNREASVARVVASIDAVAPDFVIAVGGGRVTDVAKLAAARRDAHVVTVPTQLSSDAVCSPVAIILEENGHQQSVGAQMPAAILVDMDVAERAPRDAWLAGLGDLISNLSAVRDWRLAHEANGEALDDFACLTSETAALSVFDDAPEIGAADYRQKLIRGLILSGIAMEMAGSSRPASGSEHLISHALDRLLPQPRAHGLQVALGSIAAGVFRGDDTSRLRAFFRTVGLPVTPADLGIEIEDFLSAVRLGPSMRPGRATCLNTVSERELERLRGLYKHRGL